MYKKMILILIFCIISLSISCSFAIDENGTQTNTEIEENNIINLNTNKTYNNLNDAVIDDETLDGHTIEVIKGNQQDIIISKNLTIRSLNKSNKLGYTWIPNSGSGTTISGFTIEYLHLNHANSCTIINNTIVGERGEFYILDSNNTIISNNIIYNAIIIDNSNENYINNNTFLVYFNDTYNGENYRLIIMNSSLIQVRNNNFDCRDAYDFFIYVYYSSVNIEYNRMFSQNDIQYIYANNGQINLTNNWYGSNYNLANNYIRGNNYSVNFSAIGLNSSVMGNILVIDLIFNNNGINTFPYGNIPDGIPIMVSNGTNVTIVYTKNGNAQYILNPFDRNLTIWIDNYESSIITPNINSNVINWNIRKGYNNLQDAINDAETLNGHIIEIKGGNYDRIDLNKDLKLIANGTSVTKFFIGDGASDSIIVGFIIKYMNIFNVNNCIIANNSFIENKVGNIIVPIYPNFITNFYMSNCDNITICNNEINILMYFLSSENVLIANNNIISSTDGYLINAYMSTLNITGNFFKNDVFEYFYKITIDNSYANINFNVILGGVEAVMDSVLNVDNNWWGNNSTKNVIDTLWSYVDENPTYLVPSIEIIDNKYLLINLNHNNLGQDMSEVGCIPKIPVIIKIDNINITMYMINGVINYTINTTKNLKDLNITIIINNYRKSMNLTYLSANVTNWNIKKGYNNLQDAINDVETLNGHVIEIRNGKYGNITLNKNLTLFSTNKSSIDKIFILSGGSGSIVSGFEILNLTINSAYNCQFINNKFIQILAPGTPPLGTVGSSYKVWISNCQNIIFENCEFLDLGIYMEYSDNIIIENNTIKGYFWGPIINTEFSIFRVTRNIIENTYGTSIPVISAVDFSKATVNFNSIIGTIEIILDSELNAENNWWGTNTPTNRIYALWSETNLSPSFIISKEEIHDNILVIDMTQNNFGQSLAEIDYIPKIPVTIKQDNNLKTIYTNEGIAYYTINTTKTLKDLNITINNYNKLINITYLNSIDNYFIYGIQIPNYVNVTFSGYVNSSLSQKYIIKSGTNGIIKLPTTRLITIKVNNVLFEFVYSFNSAISDLDSRYYYFIPLNSTSLSHLKKYSRTSGVNKSALPGILVYLDGDFINVEFLSSKENNVDQFSAIYNNTGMGETVYLNFNRVDRAVVQIQRTLSDYDDTGLRQQLANYFGYKLNYTTCSYDKFNKNYKNYLMYTSSNETLEFFENFYLYWGPAIEIITTYFKYGNISVKKNEEIKLGAYNIADYGNGTQEFFDFEIIQSFAIASVKITDSIMGEWLNKSALYPVGRLKAAYGTFLTALTTIWLNDKIADIHAKNYNITWKRINVTLVMVGISNKEGAYVHSSDASMGMQIIGNNTANIIEFRYINSIFLSEIEKYALSLTGIQVQSSLENILIAIENYNFSIIQYDDLFILVSEDGSNSQISVNTTSGLVKDIIIFDNFTYKGVVGNIFEWGLNFFCFHDYLTETLLGGLNYLLNQSINKNLNDLNNLISLMNNIYTFGISKAGYLIEDAGLVFGTSLSIYGMGATSIAFIPIAAVVGAIIGEGVVILSIRDHYLPDNYWQYVSYHRSFPGFRTYPTIKGNKTAFVEVKLNPDLTPDRDNAIYIDPDTGKRNLTREETYNYF